MEKFRLFNVSKKPKGFSETLKSLMFCIIQCFGFLETLKSLMFCIIQCFGFLETLKSLMFCIIQSKLKICISILKYFSKHEPLLLTDIRYVPKSVLHNPVQAKNLHLNPYIYILYYQLNILNYLPPKSAGYP